ncbi:DUF6264 family protein [Subtercola lobariae]|uniref:Uncharacterized protein n=1 Tax=Subtercola lobariae TaxID=1588641 RepID=A0A917B8C6_9MICO|nr:DUF6264 family protein [Subtercola lobariae]GGF27192.1 hypothetical protein GCM10011399_20600 [Subtercola lobariae]
MSDDRPKPKYGELAPEGWTWTPPAPPAESDVPVPSGSQQDPGAEAPRDDTRSAAPYSAPLTPYPRTTGSSISANSGDNPARKPVNTIDVVATGLLLLVGVLLSASTIPALFNLNPVLTQAAAMQGYGSFAPSEAAHTAGTIAGVVTIILQLLAIVVGVRRLQRRKLAFVWVLLFGIVTFAVWIAAITYAFFNDPAFVQQIMSTTKAG